MDEWAVEPRAALSIVHPWDPWDQGIGGFDTALDGILRYAPRECRRRASPRRTAVSISRIC